MKKLKLAISVLAIALGLSACSGTPDPGPLGAGNSRIRVHCSGFDLNTLQVIVYVSKTNQAAGGGYQNLSCIFSGDVYFDVAVPPNAFDVVIQGVVNTTITFTAAGQYAEYDYKDYFISGGGSF